MSSVHLLPDVEAIVAKVFAEDGILVRRGGRHTPEQLTYASSVARVLCGRTTEPLSVGLIEAETGIGKSLGYLVPALALLGIKNERSRGGPARIVTSTYTRALQRQIMESDLPLATSLVADAGVTPPVWAYRMGREAFWSPSRVEAHVALLKSDHPLRGDMEAVTAWNGVLRAAEKSVRTGSGLWLDYLADAGRWPAGIASKDVCLVPEALCDNDRYIEHKEAASRAQLVVTNHATLLVSIANEGVLGERWEGLVVDEAHGLVRVAESHTTTRLQPREMVRVAHRVGAMFPSLRRPQQLEEVAVALEATLKVNRKPDRKFNLNDQEIGNAVLGLATEAARITTELHKACASRIKDAGCTREQAAAVSDLAAMKIALERWNGTNPYLQKGVAFSPVREFPSLMTASAMPGRLVKALLGRRVTNAVFTSATMTDGLKEAEHFISFRQETGLAEQDLVVTMRLTPSNYGTLDFVVSAPDCPAPFIQSTEEETAELNPSWVQHCAGMVREAMATGKTLVLTSSFAETRALREALGGRNVIEHQAGASVGEYITDFQEGDAAALISPGAWEGVSLQTKRGGQLIKNLVITRLPFPSPSPDVDDLRRELMISRGYSASAADGVLHVRRLVETCQRLRQGIGRAIRGPSHRVTVWMCDPRMPAIGAASRYSSLLGAIPARFRGRYAAARAVSAAGARNVRRPIMRGNR